jgi:adenylate cyclase
MVNEKVSESLFERAYRRLGPRYPSRALFLVLQLNYVVILVAVAAVAFNIDMSTGEFVRLVLVAWILELVHDLLALRVIHDMTRPVVDWLEGGRTDEATSAAWQAAASLPWDFLRRDTSPLRRLGIVPWLAILGWCVYFAWELDLPWYAAAFLFVGAGVYFSYAFALRFFALERVMRPVVEDVARKLPDGAAPKAPGLSLRARLLTALPAINVVTAVAAYGFARGGAADLSELAVVTVVATAVAGTISLALSLLLSNSITAPIVELRAATERVGAGDFETRVPVVTTDETGDLARSFNKMTGGLAERERIREAFGTYVDRDVAEHILSEGTSLAGEEVEVTMMFIDIRDFTGFAERSSAPEVVATLNRLFESIVPLIHEHGGHVDKFVGDGLLAVFGAPRRQEDHANQALAAALEIERAVHEQMGGELEIGVGLNSGVVVAGNVGGAGRLEFSVIGDAVNVAARVEAATRQTGDVILLAENVKRLLQNGTVGLEARPPVPLKGKRESVMLYAPKAAGRAGGEGR